MEEGDNLDATSGGGDDASDRREEGSGADLVDGEDSDDDDETADMEEEDDDHYRPEYWEPENPLHIERRRLILEILRDTNIAEQESRFRIQALSSSGRINPAPPAAAAAAPSPASAPSSSIQYPIVTCSHYERSCYIVAPCCNRIFGCRLCHDEFSPPGHPPMNRRLVRAVVCLQCASIQPPSNQCSLCQTSFAQYYCNLCNLWMSNASGPYHCTGCGICRVGGRDSFRHCDDCDMCVSIATFDAHECKKERYKGEDCPICYEELYSSRYPTQDLPCGHSLHSHCFRTLATYDYRCPVCKKAVMNQMTMAATWEARAMEITDHPLSSDSARYVDILCNDCEVKSPQTRWHFLGIRCPACNSFNTAIDSVATSSDPEQSTTTPPRHPSDDDDDNSS